MLLESEKEAGLFLANLSIVDGEDSMGSAAGIVNMCSCCDSRKKNKPFNYKGLFPCIQGKQKKPNQIQQINEDEGIWNLENTVGCVLGSDHSVFGRGPGRVETKDQLEVFLSTSSTLKKYLKAALQHRYQLLHKGRTQQRTTASNSIVELIPNTTECTGPSTFSLYCPHFYFLALQRVHFWGSLLSQCWHSSFTLLEDSNEISQSTHMNTKWIL